jgi:hypothetical protein
MATPVQSTIKAKRIFEVGAEVVAGTPVVATRIIRARNVTWGDSGSWRKYVPPYDIGRLSLRPDIGEITRKGFTGRVETDLSFEDLLLPLLAGHKGGVTPTEKTVSQNDQEWIFKHTPITGDPIPDTYTWKHRNANGAGNFDREAAFGLVTGYEISMDEGGDATLLNYDLIARTAADDASFDALTLPTPFDMLAALDWKLYIDDTWAAMDIPGAAPTYGGGTQISSTMRSMTWRYITGISPALFVGDGRLDMATYRYGVRGVELEMEFEFNGSADTERGKFETPAKRFIRLLGEGSRIGTGFNKTVLLQGAFDYVDQGFGELGREANGNDVVALRLQTLADDDDNDLEVRVINTLTAFPV